MATVVLKMASVPPMQIQKCSMHSTHFYAEIQKMPPVVKPRPFFLSTLFPKHNA